MTAEIINSALFERFLNYDPSDDDIAQFSKRWATIMADSAGVTTLAKPNERLILLRTFREFAESRVRSMISNTGERVSVIMNLVPVFPELVFPLGYDEVRISSTSLSDPTISESAQGLLLEMESEYSRIDAIPSFLREAFFRMYRSVHYRSPNGAWHTIEGLLDSLLPLQEEPGKGESRPVEEWETILKDSWLQKYKRSVEDAHNTLSLPALSLPVSHGDSPLHIATKSVLSELNKSKMPLVNVHWRTLEEIVAELLYDLGMEVQLTERSWDGGRDVIARGELIPGEPTILAVEVKHREVVPISEVRQALWANRHFPALLFVTSGRFSAGIYRERETNECMLRLYLKDGCGLEQWISQYVNRNFQ